MSFLRHPREERGASAIFLALSLVILVAALGLSVDVGNVAYERTKAQHAADAAARQLAYQCARYRSGPDCAALQETAVEIADDSLEGGIVTAEHDVPEGTVKVTVEKTIDTPLLSMIGVPTKDVAAEATAKFGVMQPTEAYDVLPLGVHYCTWKYWSDQAGTPQESTRKTTLRTDVLQNLEDLLDLESLTGLIDTKGLTDRLLGSPTSQLLGTSPVQRCDDGAGNQILTLNGASWLTDDTLVRTVVGELFDWDDKNCALDVGTDLEVFIGSRINSGFMPPGCPSHFGKGKIVEKNKTILLPIFKPSSQLEGRLDLDLHACTSLFPAGPKCAAVPPKIGVKIVGFAPFHVTGWNYSNPNDMDTSVGCSEIPMELNVRSLIAATLGVAESLLNLALGLVAKLLPTGPLDATITCHGLQGYFTKSFTKDPNATYEVGGEDFGASYASLIK